MLDIANERIPAVIPSTGFIRPNPIPQAAAPVMRPATCAALSLVATGEPVMAAMLSSADLALYNPKSIVLQKPCPNEPRPFSLMS